MQQGGKPVFTTQTAGGAVYTLNPGQVGGKGQGTTIVKLVSTAQAGPGGKATTVVSPSATKTGQPTILGISSITQQGKTFMKTIPVSSTMAKTLTTQQVGGATTPGTTKQPTMITVTTKIMSSTSGTPTKIITASMPKPQIVITTQAGAQGTIVSGAVRGSVATAAKTGAPITIIRAVTPQGAGQVGQGTTKTIQIITKGDGKQQTSASILKALQNTPGLSGATSFTITTTTNTAGVTTKLVTIPISATRPGGLFSVGTPTTAATTVAQVVANTAALNKPLVGQAQTVASTSLVASAATSLVSSTQVTKPGQTVTRVPILGAAGAPVTKVVQGKRHRIGQFIPLINFTQCVQVLDSQDRLSPK